jgi:DNA-binding protein HU-beta
MTKGDLIEALAKKLDCSKAEATNYLNTLIEEITASLVKGEEVTLTGFGTFKVSKRKARTGRNPQTGEAIQIPAMTVPGFKAGKQLKEAVK